MREWQKERETDRQRERACVCLSERKGEREGVILGCSQVSLRECVTEQVCMFKILVPHGTFRIAQLTCSTCSCVCVQNRVGSQKFKR